MGQVQGADKEKGGLKAAEALDRSEAVGYGAAMWGSRGRPQRRRVCRGLVGQRSMLGHGDRSSSVGTQLQEEDVTHLKRAERETPTIKTQPVFIRRPYKEAGGGACLSAPGQDSVAAGN